MTDPNQPLAWRHVWCLLLSLAMVAAPHTSHLPWWVTALVAMLIVWRAYIAYARLALPNRWLLFLFAVTASIGVFIGYRTLFGRDAGVALLIIMLGLKLLETRALRDAVLLIFLTYFLIITNFLYSQTIATALYMLGCTLVITASMITLHYARTEPPFRIQLRAAGILLAQAVPLMLVLFVLFPRVPGPLWGLPRDAFAGVSGLSDTMSPGSLSSLTLSDAVAFRVHFESARPRQHDLYWRGPVMWDFDGRTWSSPLFFYPARGIEATGEPVSYEITIEPHNKRWLFALDLPARVPPRAAISTDYLLYAAAPVNNRLRYEMTSYLNAGFGRVENRYSLNRALQLPADFNPRALELGRELRRQFADSSAIVNEMLGRFRNQAFHYTLEPPLLGQHPVDEFLFSTRSGFCEHYASAFAVVMRAAGIPTRIVTGYQGGEINLLGNYLIVRQADAHAWTEVWLEDQGWVRVDPTSAVSPARVDRGISAAVPSTDPLPMMVRGDFEALRQLRLTWDYMANAWNQWVLGYSPERQRWLLSNFGIDNATWQKLAAILFVLSGIIIVMLTLVVLRQIRAHARDPVQAVYLRFCDKLRRKGLPREFAEGPSDYALRLARLRPDLAPVVSAITALYIALRYGMATGHARLQELQRRVRQFSA